MAGVMRPIRYGGIAKSDLSVLTKNRIWFCYNNQYLPSDLPTGAGVSSIFISFSDYGNDVYTDILFDNAHQFFFRTHFFGVTSDWMKVNATRV